VGERKAAHSVRGGDSGSEAPQCTFNLSIELTNNDSTTHRRTGPRLGHATELRLFGLETNRIFLACSLRLHNVVDKY